MRCPLLVATVLCVAAALAGCAGEISDRHPPFTPTFTTAPGFHTVSYHGISLDVPDSVALTPLPDCDLTLPPGDLVIPVFDSGPAGCPAFADSPTTPTPRPDTGLTVVLTETGVEQPVALTLPRQQKVTEPHVTVTAAGPAATVDIVLTSIRLTRQDYDGCDQQIDPSVAPRNIESPDESVLPVPTSRVRVCEYATTGDERDDPMFWLVGSRELSDEEAADVVARIDDAPTVAGGTTAPVAPVLRLLVLGDDGNTRTLQASTRTDPQPVTDGATTVAVGSPADGDLRPLPTPFDGI